MQGSGRNSGRRFGSAGWLGLALAVVTLAAAGCRVGEAVREPGLAAAEAPLAFVEASPAFARAEVVGESVQGRPIVAQTFGSGPEVVLIIAGIHGSEPAGVPLVVELAEHLRTRAGRALLDGRTVVIVPAANPDGLAGGKRFNANNVDLNRNFPADNFDADRPRYGAAPLSQPESRVLYDVIQRWRPDRVVTIHQPLDGIDHDGPGSEPIARAMAAVCDLPVKKLGGRPGSLGSYLGIDLGVPCITPELRREHDAADAGGLWSAYGPMLLAAVDYPPTDGPAIGGK